MKEQHNKAEEAVLSPTAAAPESKSLWLRIGALVLAAAVTVVILAFSDRIAELKALGYVGAFLIMLVGNATVVFPVPGLVFVFAMGSALNPLVVGLFAGPGAALGELTGYLAGYGGSNATGEYRSIPPF